VLIIPIIRTGLDPPTEIGPNLFTWFMIYLSYI
jgi:hypothetical protein